jgi:hypothetical protein
MEAVTIQSGWVKQQVEAAATALISKKVRKRCILVGANITQAPCQLSEPALYFL